MSLGEFELIDRFFRNCGAQRADVALGIGDDAALLESPPDMQLVAAIDTMVLGNHFLAHFPPESIGHRALAVNLSDLAAMGAKPAWALLALTLTKAEPAWLEGFARGFSALARKHDVALVGGDTTSGPLCISVQLLGHAPRPPQMLRSGGKAGDIVFVSGTPGDSTAGLAFELGKFEVNPHAGVTEEVAAYLRQRFHFPTPRVELGQRLRDYASACIDVSDGLLGDAGKLAYASRCGVRLAWEQLPASSPLVAVAGETRAREMALTGGEDYELCFTVPAENVERMTRDLPPSLWGYTAIGVLGESPGAVVTRGGTVMDFSHSGFDHFAT
ncbi:MAG: thiamine-phosphate kinase [Gammaproteobacteria bacterium]